MPEKQEFKNTMEDQLKEWKEKMERARIRAATAPPEEREYYREKFEQLSDQYETARYKFSLLKAGSADAWDELRDGFEKAFAEFRKGFEKAMKKL